MLDNESFKAWLIESKGFSKEVASDNASRVNRAHRFIDFLPEDTAVDIRYRLDKDNAFNELASTVKSQLKRASILYIEWMHSRYSNPDIDSNPSKD